MATSTLGSGTLVLAGTTSGTTTVTATAVAGTTTLTLPAATDTLVGKATTDTLTNKTLTGAVMNGTLGATTPSTVAATTLTTSSTVTHNGGTANGVAYLDGSKALTTGSALVFNGTNLGLGAAPTTSWPAGRPVIEINGTTTGNLAFNGNNTNGYQIWMNSYYDGSVSRYKYNGFANNCGGGGDGSFFWNLAPSGTAGNAITFTQAMTLDASGNLGIGETSPAAKLHLASTGSTAQIITSTGAANYASISLTNTTTGYGYDVGFGGSTSLAPNSFYVYGGSTASMKMLIDSSGNLLVGGTTQLGKLTVESTTAGVYTGYNRNTNATPGAAVVDVSIFSAASPNNTTAGFYFASDNIGAKAIIYSNGGLHNYSANNVNLSDRREKTNFAPATSYLDKICAIPVQTFNYIDQNLEEDDGLTLGVVAQDVQAVAPELIMESNWANKDDEPKMRLSIYQTDLQYALMKCIQEQQALIVSMRDELDALKTKVGA